MAERVGISYRLPDRGLVGPVDPAVTDGASDVLDALHILLALAGLAAMAWVVGRVLPAVRCPHCASRSWIITGDAKQCSRCGRVFL